MKLVRTIFCEENLGRYIMKMHHFEDLSIYLLDKMCDAIANEHNLHRSGGIVEAIILNRKEFLSIEFCILAELAGYEDVDDAILKSLMIVQRQFSVIYKVRSKNFKNYLKCINKKIRSIKKW